MLVVHNYNMHVYTKLITPDHDHELRTPLYMYIHVGQIFNFPMVSGL